MTQPQTTLFWDRQFNYAWDSPYKQAVDSKNKMKEKGKKLFFLPSFTAPDTEVLQSFSCLYPCLRECLEISHLNDFVDRLQRTYWGLLVDVNFANTWPSSFHFKCLSEIAFKHNLQIGTMHSKQIFFLTNCFFIVRTHTK